MKNFQTALLVVNNLGTAAGITNRIHPISQHFFLVLSLWLLKFLNELLFFKPRSFGDLAFAHFFELSLRFPGAKCSKDEVLFR